MKSHPLPLLLALTALSMPAWSAKDDAHKGHHPAATAPAVQAKPGTSTTETARMDAQMKTMRQMHDKMMAAKTPEERSALMAEHTTVMQAGMSMMDTMSQRGTGGAPGGMAGTKGSMKGDMASHHQTMEKRMDMMQSMMQMMMDRLPAASAK